MRLRGAVSEYNSDEIDKGVFFICGSGRQHGGGKTCDRQEQAETD